MWDPSPSYYRSLGASHCAPTNMEELQDFLHLVFNSSGSIDPAKVADAADFSSWRRLFMSTATQLPPEEAWALLGTAVERRQVHELKCCLWELKTMRRAGHEVTAGQLLPLWQRAVELDALTQGHPGVGDPYTMRLPALLELPAAQHLPVDAAVALMSTALDAASTCSIFAVQRICSLPSFWSIIPEQLAGLVQAAAKAADYSSIRYLSSAPAFNDLSPAVLAAAMEAATGAQQTPPTRDARDDIRVLWRSAAAIHLTADGCALMMPALLASLQNATLNGRVACLVLLDVASLNSISVDGLLRLLEAALQHRSRFFDRIWGMPQAELLDSQQLGQLLCCAAKWGGHQAVVERICQHSAWSSIDPAEMTASLLQLAGQGNNQRSPSTDGEQCKAALEV
ncbi:hypothetical protein COO60DRAFT_419519 [Scenedesmus sp. NREL 46B-D3]|nr:hypothetical protein COO60DRAFT_419519 [Scenedesmus sp. NREL 46B-D3]